MVVEKFKQWLIEDGKADTTIASYINDVNKFNEYLKAKEAHEAYINRFYFTSYVKHLTEIRQNSPSSRNGVSRWEMNGRATEWSLFLFEIE